MDELPLDGEALPCQRHSATSRAAAEQAAEGAGNQRQKVLAYLLSRPLGATDEEIQEALGMNPSTQRPRRVELVAQGKVKDSRTVRKTRSGRNATVWQCA